MKALVGAVNQEKALVGAFSVIVQPVVKPMEHYTALVITRTRGHVPHNLGGEEVLPAAGEDVRGGVQAVAPHRGLHGPELVSPCASVRGLGVRGVGAVTTLCPGQAGLGPAHSHACVVTLVGSSSHAPGQPSPASPALQTADWLDNFSYLSVAPVQPSPAQAGGTLVLYVLYVWCHTYIRYLHVSVVAVSRVTCHTVWPRDTA